MNNNIIVLYIGNDPHVEDHLSNFSLKLGWEIQLIPTVQKIADLTYSRAPDVCLLDLDHHDAEDADHTTDWAAGREEAIIFLAASDDEDLYFRYRKAAPAGFLIKPCAGLQLRSLIETSVLYLGSGQKAQNIWQSWRDEEELQESFFIKNNHKLIKVRQLDILAVMADGNYCVIITPQRRHAVKISLRKMKLKLSPLFFKQIHRNYIIQLPKVESVDLSTGEVTLGGETYPIGGSFRQQFLDYLDRI